MSVPLVLAGLGAGLIAALWSRSARGAGITILRPRVPPYAPRDFQTICSPSPKPGVTRFRDQILEEYGGRSMGIGRACGIGGKSEHKEGRAWDWGPPNKATGDRFVADMLATDGWGRPHARARKAGIQYLIWYRRMWRAYSDPPGWHAYKGRSPHTDHVHMSFSREAAAS